jgi:hypothetical protein
MPRVITGLLSSPVPGIWRRLALISDDGTLGGFVDDRLVGQFEELGIPRHQLGLAHLLQSWQRARVPPDVAFALWLLREEHDAHGCLYRRSNLPVAETSPAIRYVQLAGSLGETTATDPTLGASVDWLLSQQRDDGSVPLIVAAGHGETGQTSRSLRALHRLGEPALNKPLCRMADHLCSTVRPQESGCAWSYSADETTVVTGSTSLALTALIEYGETGTTVDNGLCFLIDAQDPSGGWAEVPGYGPTMQNTFTAVRALRTAEKFGLADQSAAEALSAAEHWFVDSVRRNPPRSTLDLAFAVRLAVQLDLTRSDRAERLALALVGRRRETLRRTADLYADTELAAIALLEGSQAIDEGPDPEAWPWRWKLPSLPPPFMSKGTYFYDLLYSVVNRRWWVRFVDWLVGGKILEHSASLLFATVVAFGVVDPDLTEPFALSQFDVRRTVAFVLVLALVVGWIGVKVTARSLATRSTWTTVGAIVLAIATTWVLAGPTPLVPDLLTVTAMRWLVIDGVAFTADRSGLLDRLLPKP